MKSVLDQLRQMTVIVADTGDLAAVKRYAPTDCTTNPSLVLGALSDPAAEDLVEREIRRGKSNGLSSVQLTETLTVALGAELTNLVPGRVSTEVDACLSFDTAASVRRAEAIISDYKERNVGQDRVLIKLAATWEGIRAAEILQKRGIDCNLTLLFSLPQAVACANAGVYLISPFVGRITDWYKKAEGREGYEPDEDPGVKSVRRIYDYYKSNGIRTVVMAASFRNTAQIKALAGCDNLTISPKLLDELMQEESLLVRRLSSSMVSPKSDRILEEQEFRWEMNADAMATDKLAEGIRSFDHDHKRLISMVASRMAT